MVDTGKKAKQATEKRKGRAIRIVESGLADPRGLVPNPKNWRLHPQAQMDALRAALDEIGWVQDVVVNRRTGNLIDGHARLELAIQAGEESIPVKYVDLTEAEERLALATVDPIGALAETNAFALKDLLDEVTTGSAALQRMLGELAEAAGITAGAKERTVEGAGNRNLLDQAIQLKPPREYMVVICDTDEEWERLKAAVPLGPVRRGGYRPGSEFDQTGTQRVVYARTILDRLEASR